MNNNIKIVLVAICLIGNGIFAAFLSTVFTIFAAVKYACALGSNDGAIEYTARLEPVRLDAIVLPSFLHILIYVE